MSLGLCMMVKDESKNIIKTLKSCLGVIDVMIILDTGSQDNTVELIKNFSKLHEIPCFILENDFEDFSTSRNKLFDFASKINVKYLLLLDSNDELINGLNLRQFVKSNKMFHESYYIKLEWERLKNTNTYYKKRLIKNTGDFKFFGKVHEYLSRVNKYGIQYHYPSIKLDEQVKIYNLRDVDYQKSMKRYKRDYELLQEEYNVNKTPRTVFYLAQTCSCLKKYLDEYSYLRERVNMGGFDEEIFHSYMRLGKCAENLKLDNSEIKRWYYMAYEHSERLEPICRLSEIYNKEKNYRMSYFLLKNNIKLQIPENILLFINYDDYKYKLWHLLGISSYYVKNMELGKESCKRAIKEKNLMIDKNNLKFYNK